MALEADDLQELKALPELALANVTPATRICVQKGNEELKWMSVDTLTSYLRTIFP